MRRNLRLVLVGLSIGAVVAIVGSAGVASAEEVSNPPGPRCNTSGRTFCIDVTTFQNITNSDPSIPDNKGLRYTWVQWKMTNTMKSAQLTHPTITVTLADDCTAVDPKDCTGTTKASFVASTIPSNCTGGGQTLTCTYTNLNAGGNTGFTKIFFRTKNVIANAGPGFTRIFVRGTVKERANDANMCAAGDPNCDTFVTYRDNSYEPFPNSAFSYALNGNSFHLETNDTFSSFEFKSNKPSPFRADFVTTFPTTQETCGATPSPTCFFRELTVTTADPVTTGYNQGPVVFYARLDTTGVQGANQTSIDAIHTYSSPHTPNPDIIGDDPGERDDDGCTFTFSSSTISVPSICVKKVQGQSKLFDVWVWDNDNGEIKFG